MKLPLALLVACAVLSAQVSVPKVGFARFGPNIYAVYGIPENFRVSAEPSTLAQSASFSDAGGLVSQDGVIRLLAPDGALIAAFPSDEPAPILNVDGSLSSAIAWLPSRHALLRWNSSGFVLLPLDDSGFGGEVVSVQLTSPRLARLLVLHPGLSVSAVLVSTTTGAIVSSDFLPSARGRSFAQHSFVLSEDPQGLAIESVNGLRRVLPLPLDLTIERMSTDWLHISSAATRQHWALYLTDTNLNLSLLPPPQGSAQ